MSKTAVILGAKGRFGRNAVEAFCAAGWTVIATGRRPVKNFPADNIEIRHCDLNDRRSTIEACVGADVIVNAAHPPYTEWAELTPTYTANVIEAARQANSTIMIPGNIYGYGATMPEILTEDTPFSPTTKKGRIRVDMEETYRAAAHEGIQTIILRAGDFYEGVDTGNWFESHMLNKIDRGIMTYPGGMATMHAWAYLPDMARAMVGLAEARDQLKPFETFGFEGHSLTGQELKALTERILGKSIKVKAMPWGIMRLLALFQPLMREVLEMKYLWTTPHRIDGRKLQAVLPWFQNTPAEDAIAKSVQ